MLHLNLQGLRDRGAWEAAGIALPKYDIPAIPGNEVNLSKPAEIVLPENRISLFL